MSAAEVPLYHRSETCKLVCRQFRGLNGNERGLVPSTQATASAEACSIKED
jgi:hypothetical protein